MQPVRVFVSSPGDVQLERQVARRVLHRLQGEFAEAAAIEPYFWEYEPVQSTRDFQSQIPATSTFDIVICILWSRLGTPLGPQYRRLDGTPYNSGTEYEFEDAAKSNAARGTPDLLVYRNQTVPQIKLLPREERERQLTQFDALQEFLNGWTRDGDVFKRALTTYTDIEQFEERFTEHLRKLLKARYRVDGQVAAERPRATWTEGSPFRGLEAFEVEHAPVFRGRTRAMQDVIGLCRRQHLAYQTWFEEPADRRAPPVFVLVAAMSGIGKSSLIRAGVLPLLTEPGVIERVSLWRRAILRPTSGTGNRLEALAAALSAPEGLPELLADGTTLAQLTQLLREKPASADVLVKGGLSQAAAKLRAQEEAQLRQREAEFAAQGRPDDADRCRGQLAELGQRRASLVVVVDQLEELFTASDSVAAQESEAFLVAVDALARCGRVMVLATIRSDFLARAAQTPTLATLSNEGALYQLEAPRPAELAQIIREPAKEAGLTFEEDRETGSRLDDVLLAALRSEPMALPLLEFTLDQLYQQRDPQGRLLHATYRALDGVEGALAKRAEEEYAALGADARAAFGRVFGVLINLHDVRGEERPVRRRAAYAQFAFQEAAVEFVERFVRARLFVVDRDRDGERSVAVVHEAMFSHWARLKAWIEEHTEELRLAERLRNATQEWVKNGRTDSGLLYRGTRLAEAREWRERNEVALNEQERAFLDASRAQAEADRRAVQRRVRLTIGGLLAALFLISSLAVYALAQAGEARRQTDAAEAAKNDAVHQEVIARSRELATSALGQLPTNPELSLLLATQAAALSPTTQAEYVLRQSLLESHARARFTGHTAEVTSAAFSPDGQRVLTGSWDNTAEVWDAASGQQLALLQGHTGFVNTATFSPDGQRVVTAGAGRDRTARVWEAASGQQLAVFQGHAVGLSSAAFSPDGQRVVTASGDKTARVSDAASGQQLAVLQGHTDWVITAAFSPDGQRVVTASGDKTARVWEVATGQQLAVLQGHTGFVAGAAFSPDGQRVVTAGIAGTQIYGCEATCSVQNLLAFAQTRVTRQLTSEERQQYLHESPDQSQKN